MTVATQAIDFRGQKIIRKGCHGLGAWLSIFAVDVVRGALCKAAASSGLSCLTMGAIERSQLLTARPSY
jgi:hypothetical protein